MYKEKIGNQEMARTDEDMYYIVHAVECPHIGLAIADVITLPRSLAERKTELLISINKAFRDTGGVPDRLLEMYKSIMSSPVQEIFVRRPRDNKGNFLDARCLEGVTILKSAFAPLQARMYLPEMEKFFEEPESENKHLDSASVGDLSECTFVEKK